MTFTPSTRYCPVRHSPSFAIPQLSLIGLDSTISPVLYKNNALALLTGVLHPNQKLACFVLYLKIINTILRNNVCILKQLSKELKYGIEILVDQVI